MNNNVAILINSCDSYHDVINLNICALKEYWPESANMTIYINSESYFHESDMLQIRNLNLIPGKSSEWGSRLVNSLTRIKEEYIVVILDDYILESKLDNLRFDNILKKFYLHNSISCFYLNFGKFSLTYDSNLDLYFVDRSNNFLINTGPAVWRKSDLISIVNENDNPWAWEFFSKFRDSAKNMYFYSVKNDFENLYNYNHIKGGAIYRGKWVEEVVTDKIYKYNLNINLSSRGVAELDNLPKRSLFWKVDFFLEGFRMVGFKAFNLVSYYIVEKFKKYLHV
jgi:hypothetical protein